MSNQKPKYFFLILILIFSSFAMYAQAGGYSRHTSNVRNYSQNNHYHGHYNKSPSYRSSYGPVTSFSNTYGPVTSFGSRNRQSNNFRQSKKIDRKHFHKKSEPSLNGNHHSNKNTHHNSHQRSNNRNAYRQGYRDGYRNANRSNVRIIYFNQSQRHLIYGENNFILEMQNQLLNHSLY